MFLFMIASSSAQTGRVGINTATPGGLLHVNDGSVVFTGTALDVTAPIPVSGPGIRMMWLPELAAFRVGKIDNNNWDTLSVGTCSFATGLSSKASGNYSFAAGNQTNATRV